MRCTELWRSWRQGGGVSGRRGPRPGRGTRPRIWMPESPPPESGPGIGILPLCFSLQVEGLGRGFWGFLRCGLLEGFVGARERWGWVGGHSRRQGSVQHLMQSELLQIQNWSVPNPAPLQVPEEPHHSPRAKLLAWPQLPFLPTHSPTCPCQSSAPEPPASALCRLPSSVPPQPLALARPHSLTVSPHPSLRPGLLPASSSPHSELTLFLPYFQPSCGFPVPQSPGLAFIYIYIYLFIYLFMYLFNCTRS